MKKVDHKVLSTLTDKALTDDHIRQMLLAVKEQRIGTNHEQQAILKQQDSELEKNRQATERLYEAVEQGLLPLDATLMERAPKLQSRRQETLTEVAGIMQEVGMPRATIREEHACLMQRAPEEAARSRDRASGSSTCGCW
jgi:hypothetical protein